jgi:hypothetical protein
LKHKGSLNSNNDETPNDGLSSHEVDDSDKERAHVETQAKSSRLVPMHDKVVKSNGY